MEKRTRLRKHAMMLGVVVAFTLLGLLESRAQACEPCVKKARDARASAQAARANVAKLGGAGRPVAGGSGAPSQASLYAQEAELYERAAQSYDAAYAECKAGKKNLCSDGTSPTASGSGGANGSRPPSRDAAQNAADTVAHATTEAFQRNLAALRQMNDALARSVYGGAAGTNAVNAARSVGNVDLEDLGSDDPTRPRPTSPSNAAVTPRGDQNSDARAPRAEPPAPPTAAAPSTTGDPTAVLNTLVPLSETTPASPEQLLGAMMDVASTAPPAAPTEVLGLRVNDDSGEPSRTEPASFSLSPENVKNVDDLARSAFAHAAPQVFPDATAAVGETRAALAPLMDVHTALTDSSGKGIEAGARVIARGAENERVKKDIETAGTIGGGAPDMLMRGLDGGSEESATSRERFVDRIGNGDLRALSYMLPKPVQKLVGAMDRIEDRVQSASETATKIYSVGKQLYREAGAIRNEVRERVYAEVRGLFGITPPDDGR